MPFYDFRQNNSGGSWDYSDRGISVNVIIEADSVDEANTKAENLGLYFDGAGDCNCCGNRWDEFWGDPKDVPSIYTEEVKPGDKYPAKDTEMGRFGHKWMEEGKPEGFIHYKDGRVEGFWAETDERKDLDGSFGYGVNFGPTWDEALVFMVTSNGYDESGNRRSAGKGNGDILSTWVKPDKVTISVRNVIGGNFLEAWFPTEDEALAFAVTLSDVGNAINDAHRKLLAAIESDPVLRGSMSKAHYKKALSVWKKS